MARRTVKEQRLWLSLKGERDRGVCGRRGRKYPKDRTPIPAILKRWRLPG